MEEGKAMVPSLSDTKLTNVVLSNGKQYSSPDDLETFYIKLTDLLDSHGLTLIFNVRETYLDLYLFYLEVTKRGGYHQVGQQKKWGEVVSALKLEGNDVKLCAQVEKLYALLLYKFEKLYFYRFPATQTATSSTKDKRKENTTASLSQLMDDGDYLMAARLSKDYPIKKLTAPPPVTDAAIPPVVLQTPSKDKEKKKKKKRGAPTGRSGYQIFLKQECARLKACYQDIDRKVVLRTAVEAWNKMSDNDKQPYVEESKKIKQQNKEAKIIIDNKQKEQSKEAMIIDNNKNIQANLKMDEKKPHVVSSDHYCVTSQPLPHHSFVNNAAVDLDLKMTEKTSKDPFFAVDLDTYRSVDLQYGEFI